MYIFEDLLNDIKEDLKNGATSERIYKKYGGTMVYIPQRPNSYKEKIIEEFNGYNYAELSRKYNISEYSVRRLVRKSKEVR